MGRTARGWGWVAAIALGLIVLAMIRPVDHDESQYVAAAALTAHGLLPYRDFAYLQTPLQPFLFAPIAWGAGEWSWPALRIVNALLGLIAIGSVYRAARTTGANCRVAVAATALFASCDILLFSVATARNDALPVACLAAAIWLAVRVEHGGGNRGEAMLAGLFLAGAAAAKVSYAVPALAYGLYAIAERRHRPSWILLGTLPVAAFLGWMFATSPAGFVFGVFVFPATAPAEYYALQPWKLSVAAKGIDVLKFLALGPGLLAAAIVAARRRTQRPTLLDWFILAGLLAALVPSPTWRQYLLPMLPPLFVRLAGAWTRDSPSRLERVAAIVFACAGLSPSVAAVARDRAPLDVVDEGRAIGAALDSRRVTGPVATLSPEILPAARRLPDPRFATGPFYFRSHALARGHEADLKLVSRETLATAVLPEVVLVGGEARWTSGDPVLDSVLADAASARGYRPVAVDQRFTLWIRRPALVSPPPVQHNNP